MPSLESIIDFIFGGNIGHSIGAGLSEIPTATVIFICSEAGFGEILYSFILPPPSGLLQRLGGFVGSLGLSGEPQLVILKAIVCVSVPQLLEAITLTIPTAPNAMFK